VAEHAYGGRPIIRMGWRMPGNQGRLRSLNYTKPYIFFLLHSLSVHVKRDLQTRD
jgi:hypothetical protein